MGALLKKLTTLVKDGILGTVSLPLEYMNHEEKKKNRIERSQGRLNEK